MILKKKEIFVSKSKITNYIIQNTYIHRVYITTSDDHTIGNNIKFLHMFDVVAEAVERLAPYAPARDLRDVFEIDRTARHLAAERITKLTA